MLSSSPILARGDHIASSSSAADGDVITPLLPESLESLDLALGVSYALCLVLARLDVIVERNSHDFVVVSIQDAHAV